MSAPWVTVDGASAAATRPFANVDIANAMQGSRVNGAARAGLGIFPEAGTSSSASSYASERENRPPARIRTNSLSTVIPTSLSGASSPTKSPQHLRPDPLPLPKRDDYFHAPAATTPPSLTQSLLLRVVPHRYLPNSVLDAQPLQYPRSPSLMRPHPATRHGPGAGTRWLTLSPRRAIILSLVCAFALAMFATRSHDERLERWNEWRTERLDALKQMGSIEALKAAAMSRFSSSAEDADSASPIDYGAVLEDMRDGEALKHGEAGSRHAAAAAHAAAAREQKPAPAAEVIEDAGPEEQVIEDEPAAQVVRPHFAQAVAHKPVQEPEQRKEDPLGVEEPKPAQPKLYPVEQVQKNPAPEEKEAPLPFVADPADAKDESALDAPDAPEDEQAGLDAVVQQAAKDDEREAKELAEKLEAEKLEREQEKAATRPEQPAAPAVQEVKVKKPKVMEKVVATSPEAEAKAQAAVEKAVAQAKKKVASAKQKDASRYKHLLPLGVTPRRYLYGANFVLAADDHTEVDDPELTNLKVKVPSKKKLAKMHADGKKRFFEEEPEWRAYQWPAPPADPSLQRLLDKLKPEERMLRDWIQHLHMLPTGHGVGLGQESGPSSELASLGEPPVFDRGNREKWSDLIVQAQEGHAGKCRGGKWLEDYQKMHAEMLDGTREPKFISYHCETGINCGGLGDRLLGMTSTFFFGLLTQRAFLAEWQSPVPIDVVFDSPHIDWSHSTYTADRHPVLGQKQLASKAAELDIIHFDRLSVDATFGTVSWNPKRGRKPTPGFEMRDLAYQSPWIKFYTNRGMIYRSFKYKHLQKSLNRLGLEPNTAFACISEYLFKPKLPALDLITQYTSVLALPTVFSVGIHIRTGDQSMRDAEYDKVNTVKRHVSFFRCARELGETYARKDQRVVFYLVTDSAHLKQDAQRVLGSKLVTTDMVPQHVHQKSGHVDGVMNAVVEDWILAKADMLVATQDSGFGKLASFMMAKPNSTVTIFPKYNPDVMGLMTKKSHTKVDCTSPTVFTSYEELSSEWSLG
ncbi:uncharacterized protein JCM10292_005652 [Rhodotorula paludigena]|uniref:uncharacterized protein n=1 Tax=Rhodotorula paludigena TaxID=86838 RepID=UPI00316DC77C